MHSGVDWRIGGLNIRFTFRHFSSTCSMTLRQDTGDEGHSWLLLAFYYDAMSELAVTWDSTREPVLDPERQCVQ